jgi:hypothetical protein
MIGEGEPLDTASSDPTKLGQATEAVQAAAETVRQTTYSVADAIEAGRRPGAPLDVLARWTQQAPLQMLAVAFLFGVTFGRRRR